VMNRTGCFLARLAWHTGNKPVHEHISPPGPKDRGLRP
jgi:hypothetical protein